jgi:cytochrome b subunit of formate dehydrogenase
MKYFLAIAFAVALITGLLMVFGYFTCVLWNYALVPQGLKEINAFTGMCLNALGTLIFGSGHFAKGVKVSSK